MSLLKVIKYSTLPTSHTLLTNISSVSSIALISCQLTGFIYLVHFTQLGFGLEESFKSKFAPLLIWS